VPVPLAVKLQLVARMLAPDWPAHCARLDGQAAAGGTIAVLVRWMMPMDGFHVLVAAGFLQSRSRKLRKQPSDSSRPAGSIGIQRGDKELVHAGREGIVFDHVPLPELKTASSPLMLTRVNRRRYSSLRARPS